MPIEITNDTIHNLVQRYITNKTNLPKAMRIIGNWDVSRVTNMAGLFYEQISFNEDINNWDVSNVTNMSEMFYRCQSFDKPLNKWNVSNVTNMKGMFYRCNSFNQPLNYNPVTNAWNVSKVTDMSFMFCSCSNFNKPLNRGNVSNVIDMSFMFEHCLGFNQDLSNWDVFNVENMNYMFYFCVKLRINPKWIINDKTRTDNMFVHTPLKGLVLEKSHARYNVVKANRDVDSTMGALSKTNIPEDLIEEITTYFDPEMETKTRKARRETGSKKKLSLLPDENQMNDPGGGGFFPPSVKGKSKRGGKSKGRKTTHKRNKKG